jgi:hypothetical protein
MWQDEIHKFREEHAKSFNYDLDAIIPPDLNPYILP